MFARGEGGNHEGRVGKQHVAGDRATDTAGVPKVADRTTFEAELGRLRVREKAHTHEGDAIAAARPAAAHGGGGSPPHAVQSGRAAQLDGFR
jgi:hypothetical protein